MNIGEQLRNLGGREMKTTVKFTVEFAEKKIPVETIPDNHWFRYDEALFCTTPIVLPMAVTCAELRGNSLGVIAVPWGTLVTHLPNAKVERVDENTLRIDPGKPEANWVQLRDMPIDQLFATEDGQVGARVPSWRAPNGEEYILIGGDGIARCISHDPHFNIRVRPLVKGDVVTITIEEDGK